jgi:biotin operon repressor
MIRRQREILFYLMKRNDSVIGSQIAKEFHVSLRTVRNDIKKINEEILSLGIKVNSSKTYGYYLSDNEKQILYENKRYFEIASHNTTLNLPETSQERAMYILLKLCTQKTLNLMDVEDELFITTTTVNQDVKKLLYIINKKFPKLKIIFVKSNILMLDGTEESKRDLISGIFSQTKDDILLMKYMNYIFDSDFNKIFNMVYVLICSLDVGREDKFTGNGLKSFTFDIVISYFRNKNDKFKIEKIDNDISQYIFNIHNQLQKLNINLSQSDLHFLQKRYHTKTFLLKDSYYIQNQKWIDGILSQFNTHLKNQFNMSLDKKFQNEEMKLLLECIILRIENGYYYDEYFKNELFDHDTLAFILSYMLGNVIHSVLGYKIDKNNLYLIASSLSGYLRKNFHIIEAYLVCNQDKGYCVNLIDMLKRISADKIYIKGVINSMDYFFNKNMYENEMMIINSNDFQFYEKNNIRIEKIPVTYADVVKIEEVYFKSILKNVIINIDKYSDIKANTFDELLTLLETQYHLKNNELNRSIELGIYKVRDEKMIIPYIDYELVNIEIKEIKVSMKFNNFHIEHIIIIRIGKIDFKEFYALLYYYMS